MRATRAPGAIWTVGHSSRSSSEFLELLASFRVQTLADVRRHAGSRAFPHFNAGPLERALAGQGIEYAAIPALGGRRSPRPDSTNTAWRNRSFRGYADHMETDEYRAALDRLLALAARRRTALMCAEALWWRCHRALIADDLKSRGLDVFHVTGLGKATEHPYTSAARIVEGRLAYGPAAEIDDLFAGGGGSSKRSDRHGPGGA